MLAGTMPEDAEVGILRTERQCQDECQPIPTPVAERSLHPEYSYEQAEELQVATQAGRRAAGYIG